MSVHSFSVVPKDNEPKETPKPFTLDWLYTIPEAAFDLSIKDYLLMVESQLEALHQSMYNRARSEYVNRRATLGAPNVR